MLDSPHCEVTMLSNLCMPEDDRPEPAPREVLLALEKQMGTAGRKKEVTVDPFFHDGETTTEVSLLEQPKQRALWLARELTEQRQALSKLCQEVHTATPVSILQGLGLGDNEELLQQLTEASDGAQTVSGGYHPEREILSREDTQGEQLRACLIHPELADLYLNHQQRIAVIQLDVLMTRLRVLQTLNEDAVQEAILELLEEQEVV